MADQLDQSDQSTQPNKLSQGNTFVTDLVGFYFGHDFCSVAPTDQLIDPDGELNIPIFHVTSAYFLSGIAEHGLDGQKPLEAFKPFRAKLYERLMKHPIGARVQAGVSAIAEVEYQASIVAGQVAAPGYTIMTREIMDNLYGHEYPQTVDDLVNFPQFLKQQDWEHGRTCLTISAHRASSYFLNSRLGPETIRQCTKLIEALKKLDDFDAKAYPMFDAYDEIVQSPLFRPALILAQSAKVDSLISEDKLTSARTIFDDLQKRHDLGDFSCPYILNHDVKEYLKDPHAHSPYMQLSDLMAHWEFATQKLVFKLQKPYLFEEGYKALYCAYGPKNDEELKRLSVLTGAINKFQDSFKSSLELNAMLNVFIKNDAGMEAVQRVLHKVGKVGYGLAIDSVCGYDAKFGIKTLAGEALKSYTAALADAKEMDAERFTKALQFCAMDAMRKEGVEFHSTSDWLP